MGTQLGHKKVNDVDKDEKVDLCEKGKRRGQSLRTSSVLHMPPYTLIQVRLLPGESWIHGPGTGRRSAKDGQPDLQPGMYILLSE